MKRHKKNMYTEGVPMKKKKNNLLNTQFLYNSPLFSTEEIIRRLKPIIQYQQRACTIEYIVQHGQAEHINTILTALKRGKLKKEECIRYGLDTNSYTFPNNNKKINKTNNWIAKRLEENYEIKDIGATDLFKYMKLLHCPQENSYMSLLKKYKKNGKEHAERWSLSTSEIEQLQRFEGEGDFIVV